MTKPHDQYARLLLDQMLSGYGSVLEEFPLSPSPPRAVDLVFVPGPTADDAIPLGAMAPLSTGPCLVEVYSRAPGRLQYDTALGKLLDIHRQGRRRSASPVQRRLRDATLWMLCAGHPRTLLLRTEARPMQGRPPGFYRLCEAHAVRIVSVAELPLRDDTLLLRLLAQSVVRRDAQATLRDRARLDPRLVPLLETMVEYARRLRHNPRDRGAEAMVDLTEVRKWAAELERKGLQKGLQEGLQKGLQEGLQEGLKEGLQPILRQVTRRFGRPLTEAEQATLLSRFDLVGPDRLGDVVLDFTPAELAAWLADPDAR